LSTGHIVAATHDAPSDAFGPKKQSRRRIVATLSHCIASAPQSVTENGEMPAEVAHLAVDFRRKQPEGGGVGCASVIFAPVRSAVVITVLALVAASVFATGCRPYKGAPEGPAAMAAAEHSGSGGTASRAVFDLPNGLHVILEENHAAPVVAIQAWIQVGSADDPPRQEGLAHLFQHLLFTSAKAHPTRQIGGEIAAVGGRIGAWTTTEQTVFHEVIASAYVDLGLDILAAILRQPPLAPADLEIARQAAKDDLRQAAGVPDRVAVQAALATAFAGHPYGRPLLGTEASLTAISPEQVNAFFDRFYGATNTTLVLVGDFNSSMVRERIASGFGSWHAGHAPSPRARPPAQAEPRVTVVSADVPAPQLVVAFRTPDMRDPIVPALELLAAVMGPGGGGGRLDLEVARNRQLTIGPRAYLFNARDAGLLLATAALGRGRIEEAAQALIDEILRLSREPVGLDELARARTMVEGDNASDRASLDGYARKLALFTTVTADPGFEAVYLRHVRSVAASDLMDAAFRTLRSSNLTLAVVLPDARDPQRDERALRLKARLSAMVAASETRVAVSSEQGLVSAVGQDVVDYALASGVRLLVLRDDTATQVSIRAVWSGGVRFEDARLAGATSLLARLLPRGTKTRAPEQLANELREVAGVMDGIAGMDTLGIRGDFLASRWERGIELMVDCLRNPRLGDEEIERERRVLLDAIRSRDEDPTELALRLFEGALFGRHPYRQDLLGTPDSVSSLDRRRLLDHYRRYYVPRGLTIAVVGPVAGERVAAKLQSLFADVPARPGERATASTPALPTRSEPVEVVQFISKPEARVVIGYPGVTTRDPDRFALEVLAQVLGGPAGRLAKLREQGVLMDSITAASQEGVDAGYFAVFLGVRPDAVDALIPALRAEIGRAVENGLTDAEVARARRILIGTRSLALERRGAVALAIALHGAFGEGGRSYRRDVDELSKITAPDVLRVARRIIDQHREVLAVVRPREADRPRTSMVEPAKGYTSRWQK
jgi:zinc protease